MTNEEHRQLIGSVNRALSWPLPEKIRSISADLAQRQVTLQFVHDGEAGAAEKETIAGIERQVEQSMGDYRVDSTLIRVDAPRPYAEQLLPIVVLAMFEQEE
ncbi:hypothetical protein P0D73_34200 [Paraburkholderia sp. RL18-101-BIB-B]|jgi:hypothetical protein|uniref:hypothetical protein n=1 Tax=unclassified Paraburkholderia TaxID=2615204 RepID=UPI0038BDFB21